MVMTALLRSMPEQPVAVSLLASRLGVTQVSANEMCHKLSERGLMAYQPYKGVTLTPEGEEQAQQILSRRRLWVIFLVENLGIEPEEADELACQMEHITSERLVNSLRTFLERVPTARIGSKTAHTSKPGSEQSLNTWSAGMHGYIASITTEPGISAFLHAQGLICGAEAKVLVVGTDGTLLLDIGGRSIALASDVAAHITISSRRSSNTTRQETWARCSSFWACLHGENCVCGFVPDMQQ